MTHGVFVTHVLATWAMVGLIWTIQLVHYPLFAQVGAETFGGYHAAHTRQITLIVGPLMLLELGGAMALVAAPLRGVARWEAWLGLALVLLAWGVTALWSVPAHGALAAGFDARIHASLLSSNWLRTLAWSARGGLMGWVLWRMITRPDTALAI